MFSFYWAWLADYLLRGTGTSSVLWGARAGSLTFFCCLHLTFRHRHGHTVSIRCFLNEPAQVTQTSLRSLKNRHYQHQYRQRHLCSTQNNRKMWMNIRQLEPGQLLLIIKRTQILNHSWFQELFLRTSKKAVLKFIIQWLLNLCHWPQKAELGYETPIINISPWQWFLYKIWGGRDLRYVRVYTRGSYAIYLSKDVRSTWKNM